MQASRRRCRRCSSRSAAVPVHTLVKHPTCHCVCCHHTGALLPNHMACDCMHTCSPLAAIRRGSNSWMKSPAWVSGRHMGSRPPRLPTTSQEYIVCARPAAAWPLVCITDWSAVCEDARQAALVPAFLQQPCRGHCTPEAAAAAGDATTSSSGAAAATPDLSTPAPAEATPSRIAAETSSSSQASSAQGKPMDWVHGLIDSEGRREVYTA